jgi:hypothetical protein
MWSIGHPDRITVTSRTSASSQQRCTVAALDHALSVRDGAADAAAVPDHGVFAKGFAASRHAARASVVTNFPESNAILAASDAAAGRTSIAVMMIYRWTSMQKNQTSIMMSLPTTRDVDPVASYSIQRRALTIARESGNRQMEAGIAVMLSMVAASHDDPSDLARLPDPCDQTRLRCRQHLPHA